MGRVLVLAVLFGSLPLCEAHTADVIEAEIAFKEGVVDGAERPHHSMVASRGFCVGAGWGRGGGDRVEIPVRLTAPLAKAVLSLRYSWDASDKRPAALELLTSVDGGKPVRTPLRPTRIFEEFAVVQVSLGTLPAGTLQVSFRLSRPQEVWLDAVSVTGPKDVPSVFRRRLHFDNLKKKGHFRLVLSPHTSEATTQRVEDLFKRLEADYEFIRNYLGHEPPTRELTCCISAKEDSGGGAAHASGSLFVFDEEGALDPIAGNRVHEMTHCFQEDFASNGHMPAWIREGEAFFMCCVVDTEVFNKTVEEATWPPFRGRRAEDVRRAGLNDAGINVIQYFRTARHPREPRPFYLIWNWIFFEVFKKNPKILREFHDRLRRDIRRGDYPLETASLSDPHVVSSVFIDYLIDDDVELRRLFTEWGLITWPCLDALPELGRRVLEVSCGAGLKGEHVDRDWRASLDEVKKVAGFDYRVTNVRAWRGENETHWFYGGPRDGDRRLKLTLRVPKNFAGVLALYPDAAGRVQEVRVEGRRPWVVSGERRVLVPIDSGQSDDGAVDVEMRRRHGFNGALARVEVYQSPKTGETRLGVVCSGRVEEVGPNLDWRRRHDRVEATDGFSYRLLDGKCWTDGRSRQWFHHDRRFGNEPLRFELETPRRFEGFLVLRGEPGGRVQRVTVNGERSYRQRGEYELVIPLDRKTTKAGRVLVEVRRLEGNNCVLASFDVTKR